MIEFGGHYPMKNRNPRLRIVAALSAVALTALCTVSAAQSHKVTRATEHDWPVSNGDAAADHYSTLAQINRQNVKWAGRMAAILVLVVAAEVPIVLFTRKPLPWVAVIPALIPILTAVFVIIPMMTTEKSAHPDD